MKKIFSLSVLMPLLLAFGAENVKGQCPVDPPVCTPNVTTTSSLPDSLFFCEGVSRVLLDPKITSPTINFTWYKKNGSAWDNLSYNGSNYQVSSTPSGAGDYAVCWQTGNTGCYNSDEVVIETKSFSDQLAREKEFKLPNPIIACSYQPTPTFFSAGNAKYSYRWVPVTGMSNANIKNPMFLSSTVKGRPSLLTFSYDLEIREKLTGCVEKKSIPIQVYPILGPEFAPIIDDFCQSTTKEVEVRVVMVNGFGIRNASLQIGTNPPFAFTGADFTKIPASSLVSNTLGLPNPPNADKEINSSSTLIDVVKASISTTQSGTFALKFNMITDLGCVAQEIKKIVTVKPTTPFAVAFENTTTHTFCSNDVTSYKLIRQYVAGTYRCVEEDNPLTMDANGDYFFTPSMAKLLGRHTILFIEYGAFFCPRDGELRITVENENCPTGLFTSDKTSSNQGFKSPEIYPVPTNAKLFVNLSTEISADDTYQMIELSGRVLESGKIGLTNGANHLEFNVGHLETGNYLLKLVSDKTVSNLKFVVVK